jgi:hypothetical protein
MFVSSFSNGSYSSNYDFTPILNDHDILKNINQNYLIIFQMMVLMASSSNDLFISYEMKEGMGQYMDLIVDV